MINYLISKLKNSLILKKLYFNIILNKFNFRIINCLYKYGFINGFLLINTKNYLTNKGLLIDELINLKNIGGEIILKIN
jgi:ribosomal protein S8